jgi:hypothetical protein
MMTTFFDGQESKPVSSRETGVPGQGKYNLNTSLSVETHGPKQIGAAGPALSSLVHSPNHQLSPMIRLVRLQPGGQGEARMGTKEGK